MDVAFFLSELLRGPGGVTVPGLGRFSLSRVEGYYNEDEATLYPPGHTVHFEPGTTEDDVLTQYIAHKKHISLASSKYFTEKYITNLKQEAILNDIALADLGWINIDESGITFRPAGALSNDPAFYGYAPIKLNKLQHSQVTEQSRPFEPEPIPEPEVLPEPESVEETETTNETEAVYGPEVTDETQTLNETETLHEPEAIDETASVNEAAAVHETTTGFVLKDEPVEPKHEIFVAQDGAFILQPEDPAPQPEEPAIQPEPIILTAEPGGLLVKDENYDGGEVEIEEEEPRRGRIWITLLILLAVAALGIFGLYKYNPHAFDGIMGIKAAHVSSKSTIKHNTTKTVTPPVKGDTIKKDSSKAVTGTAAQAAVAQPGNNPGGTAIDSTKRRYEVIGMEAATLNEANRGIENFKSIGLNAHIVNDAPGRRLKISLGTYATKAEALSAINELRKSGKVQQGIWPLPINPKR